jgi:hypothetical protein
VVTERVRREHVLRGRRAFIDPLTGQPRVIYEAADLVTIEERARDTAFVTVGVETWVGTVSLTTTWTSGGQVEWINRSEARDVRFTFVRRTEDGESHFRITGGTLDYWTERPCRSYVSPVMRTELASPPFTTPIPLYPNGIHLTVADQAPAGASESAVRWFRGHAQLESIPQWDAYCQSPNQPLHPPFMWTGRWMMFRTNFEPSQVVWMRSPSADRLEGSVTGVWGGPVYRYSWRLERVIE